MSSFLSPSATIRAVAFCRTSFRQKYVRRESRSRSAGGFSRSTVQVSFQQKPLLSSADLQNLSDDKTVLFARGRGAAMLNKLNFYENSRFRQTRTKAEKMHGAMQRPTIAVPAEWPLFKAKPAAMQLSPRPAWQGKRP
ncbi:type IV secretory system conjugative DNA transfer family protein [Brucella intermedia]|uniref:type IV secretory system conjugative DNA transfer family protein n=1 Tax=Brucella intermedia TaxID=94625 RepID=UPI00178C6062|nr:type IV secretory system conjugative DNA transfer family protein [Brucella intermedia]